MANCMQISHSPATVFRRSTNAVGPLHRRARPRPFPAPARTGARRRRLRASSGPTRSSSSRRRTTPAASSRPVSGLRDSDEKTENVGCRFALKEKVPARRAGRRCAAFASARRPRPARAATPAMTVERAGDPNRRHSATAADRNRQDRPAWFSSTTRGIGTAATMGETGRVGRGRADRCLRTRPGGARRSTSLPGGKPARDGRRSNAASDHPEHAGVPDTGVRKSRRP